MSITFAGQSMLMEDPGGKFAAWLNWAMDYESFQPFARPVYKVEGRDDARGGHKAPAEVGLPVPNYPEPPRPRINSLYIPTGAGRWAQGLFLIDWDGLLEIDKVIYESAYGEAILKVDDGTTELEFTMLALDPIRVTESGDNPIFILPLVDYRWLWQWTDVGNLEIHRQSTNAWWVLLENLFDIVRDYIVVQEETSPFSYFHDVFGTNFYFGDPTAPDPVELTRRYENYAMVLDAVAACVGMRVTFDPSTLKLEVRDSIRAGDRLEDHVTENASREILRFTGEGQPSRNLVPDQVRVCYPKVEWVAGLFGEGLEQTETGELFTVRSVIGKGELGTSRTQTDTTQVFFDTFAAIFSPFALPNDPPENLVEMEQLTDQIASDYYSWLVNHYDIAYQGLVKWAPNGFDDYVLYELGTRNQQKIEGIAEDDFVMMTKVRSLPYNFGFRELLHQLEVHDELSLMSQSSGSQFSMSSVLESSTLISTESSSLISTESSSLISTESSSMISTESSSTLISTESSSMISTPSSSSSTLISTESSSLISTASSESSSQVSTASSESSSQISTESSSQISTASSESFSDELSSEGVSESSSQVSTASSLEFSETTEGFSETSGTSEGLTETTTAGTSENTFVKDVCCNDSLPGGGVEVCYATIHWKWVGGHGVYGMTSVSEESCSC